jgi:hypothetical protein
MNTSGILKAIGSIGLLMLVSGSASAYICTGPGNEFDAICDATEINTAIAPATFDPTLLAKDNDTANPGPGIGGSTQWGTLEVVTPASGLAGTVFFTWSSPFGITPQVIVEKADNWYSVYDWLTQIAFNPETEQYSFTREFGEFDCGPEPGGNPNCSAATSHVSAYGVVPVPAAVWLLGGALLGLIGVARRKAA